LSDDPISAANISEDGLYYAIGTVEGDCKIINLTNQLIESQK
jgi:hypothetical protein